MAVAPEQLGIGIGRHFTTPGTHPYDEVVWERRDARISNWKDGSVAFEQLDVETTLHQLPRFVTNALGAADRKAQLAQFVARAGTDVLVEEGVGRKEDGCACLLDALGNYLCLER